MDAEIRELNQRKAILTQMDSREVEKQFEGEERFKMSHAISSEDATSLVKYMGGDDSLLPSLSQKDDGISTGVPVSSDPECGLTSTDGLQPSDVS